MRPDEALRVVARSAIAKGAEVEAQWENYPEIGERDWDAVCAIVAEMAPRPTVAEFTEAYAILEARAEK